MSDERSHAAMGVAVDAGLSAGASDVEASYCGTETQFTRFASSRFTQVGQTWSDTLRVRVLVDGRLGTQVSASLDEQAVHESAIAAVQAARLSPELDVALAFNGGDGQATAGATAELPESVTAARLPEQLAQAFAANAEAGVQFAGSVKAYRQVLGVRTSAGLVRGFQHSFVDAQVIGLIGAASGFAGWCGPPTGAVDVNALAKTAADKARRSRDPIELEPAAYDVVLAPRAVAELLEWMAVASFSATTILDGTSLLAGRAGESLCDERITISDEPSPGEPPFDAEGTPRQPVTFIDAGKAGKPVSDLIGAARLGAANASTGHAPNISDMDTLDPIVMHLRLAPGTMTEAELIAAVDRGLYITRFHYVNGLLDTRHATMTGMTRDGTFLIENGRLGRGVRNMRFTQPMLEAFSRLGGLANQVARVPMEVSQMGAISAPAMLLHGFQFTGKSK